MFEFSVREHMIIKNIAKITLNVITEYMLNIYLIIIYYILYILRIFLKYTQIKNFIYRIAIRIKIIHDLGFKQIFLKGFNKFINF